MTLEKKANRAGKNRDGAVLELSVADAAAMERLGARIAGAVEKSGKIYLRGELGAGKTTLVRGLLRALGISGPIKSPTYTLIEPYAAAGVRIYHVDLYRIRDPEELEYLGARELLSEEALCLVEWPEHGAAFLPPADLAVSIAISGTSRRVEFADHTAAGRRLIAAVRSAPP